MTEQPTVLCAHCVADEYDPPCPALDDSTLCAFCIRFEDNPEQFARPLVTAASSS